MALTKEAGERLWQSRWGSWVARANQAHSGKFSYPSSIRVDGKLTIVCPDHGEFQQLPQKHMHGQGCPKCRGLGLDKVQQLKDKYPEWDWSDTVVGGSKDDLTLVCPEHGEFITRHNRLMNKPDGMSPCPKCNKAVGGVSRRVSDDEWRKRIAGVWGDRFAVMEPMSGGQVKVSVNCADHGKFVMSPADLVNGHGCPQCGKERFNKWSDDNVRVAPDDFVQRAVELKGGVYTYDISTFVDMRTPMRMVCNKHGEFWQIPRNHITLDAGCPACANNRSKGEDEIADYLRGLGLTVKRGDRKALGGKELDVYVPELSLAIEYCGLYWHGELYKEPNYHLEKLKSCESVGISLITLFEDEWVKSKDKVKTHLLHRIGAGFRVGARETSVVHIPWGEAKDFLDEFHMQGAGKPGSVCYALKNGGNIVAVAVWGNDRFSKSERTELYRFCSRANYQVVGGLSRLVAAYRKDYPSKGLVTYADLRWGTGNAYKSAGFTADGVTAPGYFWCKGGSRFSRQKFQKHKLLEMLETFDPSKTEVENCHDNKFWRIYDCGMSRWVIEGGGV